MTEIAYRLITGSGNVDTVVAFNPGSNKPVLEADSNHPHWHEIIRKLQDGDTSVFELFDVAGGLVTRLQQLSDRIEWDGKDILFDGDPVTQDDALANQIKRFLKDGSDYKPLVAFYEKVSTNPSKESRDHLYKWLASHDFSITEDGDVIGYKAVYRETDGNLLSSHSGQAFVNGKYVNGRVRNNVGDVVSIPRSKVNTSRNATCSTGLHVGTWSYVSTFLNGEKKVTLEVHFNPRDAVAVPYDEKDTKIRVRKYKVVAEVNAPVSGHVKIEKDKQKAWSGDVGYRTISVT